MCNFGAVTVHKVVNDLRQAGIRGGKINTNIKINNGGCLVRGGALNRILTHRNTYTKHGDMSNLNK
ncbi:AAEL003223-PA [Aedes aegypti]|uniref:AAEL003223-PA n=1 Tax=Aedes aegypti TaxID=7159 RepID=Q17FX2_AEDAE|nr:AAEL003223-PA [Aedes aegypti]